MGQKRQFQTRLDPDDADRVEAYADAHNLSNSETVRRFVRAGLDATDGPSRQEIAADLRKVREELDDDEQTTDGLHQALPLFQAVGYILAVATGYGLATIPM